MTAIKIYPSSPKILNPSCKELWKKEFQNSYKGFKVLSHTYNYNTNIIEKYNYNTNIIEKYNYNTNIIENKTNYNKNIVEKYNYNSNFIENVTLIQVLQKNTNIKEK